MARRLALIDTDRLVAERVNEAKRNNKTELFLHTLKLTKIPEVVFELKHLKCLQLFSNRLSKLPLELFTLINLELLAVSNNCLTEIPPEIGELQNLRELEVYNNRLQALPKEIGQLRRLRKLYVGYNAIEEIPWEIGDCEALQILWLPGNSIQHLPRTIGRLSQLTALNVGDNRLCSLDPGIGKLTKLTTLCIAQNILEVLPWQIIKLKDKVRLLADCNNWQLTEQEDGKHERFQPKSLVEACLSTAFKHHLELETNDAPEDVIELVHDASETLCCICSMPCFDMEEEIAQVLFKGSKIPLPLKFKFCSRLCQQQLREHYEITTLHDSDV
eukprot:Colp12_sorted_trinity150504_noHs@11553